MRKIYLKHLRPGYCIEKTKVFFIRHNLDFEDFKRNGIDIEILIATGDAMAIKLCDRADEVSDGKW